MGLVGSATMRMIAASAVDSMPGFARGIATDIVALALPAAVELLGVGAARRWLAAIPEERLRRDVEMLLFAALAGASIGLAVGGVASAAPIGASIGAAVGLAAGCAVLVMRTIAEEQISV